MKFHLNPKTGEPGLCRAETQCPFGDLAADHYATAEDARGVAEDMYEAFERGYEPASNASPGEKQVYEEWLYAIQYDDYHTAQVAKIARHLETKGYVFPEVKSEAFSTTLTLDTVGEELQIEFVAKRNRVCARYYVDEKMVAEDDIRDVNSGKALADYMQDAIYGFLADLENNAY